MPIVTVWRRNQKKKKNNNHLASSSLFVARFTLSHYLKCFAHYFYKCTIPNVQPLARCLPLDSNPPPRFGEVQWVQEGRGLLLLVRHLPPHRRHLQHQGVLRGGQVPRGGGAGGGAPGYRWGAGSPPARPPLTPHGFLSSFDQLGGWVVF